MAEQERSMITDPAVFFEKGCGRCARFDTPACSTRRWIDGLNHLRRICLDMGLTEEAKWGHPCYTHAGRNIALFGALRGDFRLSFMNGGLLEDTKGILKPAGPNAQTSNVLFFTDSDQVTKLEPTIKAYLAQLMDFAERGIRPPKTEAEFNLPDELVNALDADPELAEAFHALTPGRQRSYAINLNSAKTIATRINRIAKFRDKIIAGKGATER